MVNITTRIGIDKEMGETNLSESTETQFFLNNIFNTNSWPTAITAFLERDKISPH
jgi:hypothetical protein